MKTTALPGIPALILAIVAMGSGPIITTAVAADAPGKPTTEALSESGRALEATYAKRLTTVRTAIEQALPAISDQKRQALAQANAAVTAAAKAAEASKQALGTIQTAKALVEHAKNKWIGDAQKGITKAEATLKQASSAAERDAAKQELAKWQANKEEGIKALKEREAAYQKALTNQEEVERANKQAQAALAKAEAEQAAAASALLAEVKATLASDRLDQQLLTGVVLAHGTPRGLATFAQQSKAHEDLIERLLSDTDLTRRMLEAGGPSGGRYGRALEIYEAITKASPQATNGSLQRLALGTSLEHAVPIAQSNTKESDQSTVVDPVRRYQHYEKAYLAGELDPAFKDLTAWEYRMVVDCDASDEILAWGREMLRNYRPDHISNPNYGWRYCATVRTDVTYGSENVKCDLPSLHNYQNIIKNGGVCGRRAFFGRFILKSFGIPTWGVTQHKHAALSHWTPDGWVVNLGAGFQFSWWDKDDAPRSGVDFLLESQARESTQEYQQVLRGQWISRVLGETPYNDRKNIEGGVWSRMANYQAKAIVAANKTKTLGPLGQELAEANEPRETAPTAAPTTSPTDRAVRVERDGSIIIPAVAQTKATGPMVTAPSYAGGMQIHCQGGFRADYEFTVSKPGKYAVTARVVTVQDGQKMVFALNDSPPTGEIAVPYTIGKWAQTPVQELTLSEGKQVLHVSLVQGSRGVSIKEFVLVPLR